MKLDRLTSTTRSLSREATERARAEAREVEALRRVAELEGSEADRERSLRQELDAAAARLPGADDESPSLAEARDLAQRLVDLGREAGALLKPGLLPPSVDTEA